MPLCPNHTLWMPLAEPLKIHRSSTPSGSGSIPRWNRWGSPPTPRVVIASAFRRPAPAHGHCVRALLLRLQILLLDGFHLGAGYVGTGGKFSIC